MQRVADVVRAGGTRYIQGTTKLENVAFRSLDFHRRFQINESSARAVKARHQGRAVARWLGSYDAGLVHWVLLITAGTTDDNTEKWRDALVDRISFTGYELVRHTRAGAHSPALTWRYTKVREQELRDQLVNAIRLRHDVVVDQMVHSLWRSPGFAGVREQVKRFGALIRSEWSRSRAKNEAQPDMPKNIGYVRRLGDAGSTWSILMKELTKNESVEIKET